MNDANLLARSLTRAAEALRRRDLATARSLLRQLEASAPEHPDRLQLLGLLLRAEGDPEGAESAFRRSLAAAPEQPAVLNNLGNLLLQQGRRTEAEQAYRDAIRIDPAASDAERNLGLLRVEDERDEEAESLLRSALARRGRDSGAWTALGQCLQRRERLDEALTAFRNALEITPGHLNAVAGLGHTLRLMDRFDDAAACYDAALRSHPEALQIRTARAAIDVNLGRHEAAEQRYRQVLERDPGQVAAHRELNELLWQLGRTDEYARSFETAVARTGPDPALLQAWCEALAGGGRFAAVLEVLDRHAPDAREPGLLRMRGRALAARGERGPAMDLLARARELAPEDPDPALDHAQLAIVEGAHDRALEALDRVEALAPDHQLMWACRGLCWRLKGDGRAQWLNDPDRLVRTRRIECPPGHASLDDFLAELAARLEALHLTRAAPSNQTLRGGTQTFGRLFHRDEPLIRDLVGALSRTIAEHLAELPRDPSHPMLRRRNGRFRFSGSWSVRLAPGGYHVNHVHPAGWLSSAFYVSVPEGLGTSEADPAGWLKIGESDLGLGDRERIDRLIRPVAGELTLFPSYTWHGTVPFHGNATRLTAPFDLVPG